MIPDATDITLRRVTAIMVLRMFGVFIAAFSIIPTIAFALEFTSPRRTVRLHDVVPFIVVLLVILTFGFTLWSIAPIIARFMVRVPRVSVCPNCNFKLERLLAPQCTECGYTLTPEFLTTAGERAAGRREPDTVLLRQISTLVLRFVSGAVLPVTAIGTFISAVEAIEHPEWNFWSDVLAWFAVFVTAATVLLCASWLSVVFVPGRSRFGTSDLNRLASPAEASASDPDSPLVKEGTDDS